MSSDMRARSKAAAAAGGGQAGMQQDSEADEMGHKASSAASVKEDYPNIALLLLLYTLQGIPMGFSAAVPLILKERGASFSDIALFGVSSLPFSAKLFWAPIVDSMYIESIGRRKTWLVPAQFLIGITMIYVAYNMEDWLGETSEHKVHIVPLSLVFLFLYLLCATQDIAVDGWALTILKRENVGYASTCNTIGQTVGYFESFVLIIAVVETGYISFFAFTVLHGLLFIVVTLGVWMFKREAPVSANEEVEDMKTVFVQMAQVTQLPAVQRLLGILLTWKASAAIADNVTILKIQELGMPKEHAATLSLVLTPVQIIIPMMVTKYTGGTKPLNLAIHSYMPRTVLAALSGFALVYFAPVEKYQEIKAGTATAYDIWPYYAALLVMSLAYSVFAANMFVSQMAFFARVSDPAIGGTYMTLLNTIANLGSLLAKQVVTYGVDYTTIRECSIDGVRSMSCSIASGEDHDPSCTAAGGTCDVVTDGYYVMLCICFFFGVGWWFYFEPRMLVLQEEPTTSWRVRGGQYSIVPLIGIFSIVGFMILPTIKRSLFP
eukprot:m.184073 g.184073  ORF g.184073 m.184073 type:complete len:549 (-) comp16017_c0_seq1:29-1675(-)